MHNEKRNKITKNKIFVIRYLGTLYEQQIPYLKLFMNSFEQFIEHIELDKLDDIKVSVEFVGTTSSDLEATDSDPEEVETENATSGIPSSSLMV